jgi:hypothetical protein
MYPFFCKEWINFKSWQHNYLMVEQYLLTTHCLVGSGESHCLVVLFNAEGNVPWGLNQCCSKESDNVKKNVKSA